MNAQAEVCQCGQCALGRVFEKVFTERNIETAVDELVNGVEAAKKSNFFAGMDEIHFSLKVMEMSMIIAGEVVKRDNVNEDEFRAFEKEVAIRVQEMQRRKMN